MNTSSAGIMDTQNKRKLISNPSFFYPLKQMDTTTTNGMMMDMTMTSIGMVTITMMINGRMMDIGQVPIVPTMMPAVPL